MMAEESMIHLRPVLLEGLLDEMYPTYHFLKKRLLSIFPRFKKEEEKLFDLIQGGKQFIPEQDNPVSPLQKTVRLILIGNHEEVISEEESTWKSFIASSRCSFGDKVKLKKLPGFKLDEVKKISTRPEVIVYVVDDTRQTFDAVTYNMLKIIPEERHRSFIVCSERLGEYKTLQDVKAATGDCQSVSSKVYKTLGSRIQACLGEKVVTVLQRMLDYIHGVISAEACVEVSEIKREQLLKHAVSETLQEAGDEIQVIGDRLTGARDVYSTDRTKRIEEQTRENLPHIFGKSTTLLTMMYYSKGLVKSIKRKFVDINKTFQGATKRPKIDLETNIAEKKKGSFKAYEINLREIFENLSMIDFEIKGVFRQADYPVSPSPDISRSVQKEILSISGVNGCGVMLGKLVIHMKEDSSDDEETVTEKVEKILKSNESQYFVNRLEVKKVRVSTTAGGTYQSGQRLYVDGSFGTLGCFVKGRKDEGSSEQLYAISCAHVFPDGCNSAVKVARPQSQDLEILGHISETFKLLKEHNVDIAAIAVTPEAKIKCLHSLKNSDNCDVRQSVLHEGDLNAILGFQVYKCGAVSKITRGLIIAVKYYSQGFDSQFNIFIKNDPESSEVFSSAGDSGSVVCFDKPSEETVKILSLVTGEITSAGKHECSYSVHLKKNLEELSMRSGHLFQLYNPDQ